MLWLAGLEADLEQMPPVLGRNLGLRACQLRTKPYELPLVGRAARPRGQREVDGLEQVRLAGPIRPEHNGEPIPELGLRPLVATEVAQADPSRPHAELRRSI